MYFLELSCFFDDPMDVGNLISGSSAFSKSSLNIWKFTIHVLLKPSLENFEYYFASMWDECNCVIVWAFFGIALLWDWNENWPFPVLWPQLSFPNLLAYLLAYVFLLYWLCQSLWLCGSQQTVKNSERDGNIRPPDLPPEKSVCRSGSNS